MTITEMKGIAELAQIVIATLSIIIGAAWVVYRFILQKERFPKINFSTDINIIGKQDDFYIIELIAVIENIGKAQHKMSDFGFDLNAMMGNDKVLSKEKWCGQIDFPHQLIKGSYLPKDYKYFFVDSGTVAKYSFLTKAPLSATYLILHSRFVYSNRKNKAHTAEKTIKLNKNNA